MRRPLSGTASSGNRWPTIRCSGRERHVEGLAPLRTLRRFPLWLGVVLIALTTTVSSLAILWISMPASVDAGAIVRVVLHFDAGRLQTLVPGAEIGFLIQSVVVLTLAGLIVGVRCSGSVTGEAARNRPGSRCSPHR